jgi:hypothetical protein
VYNGGGSISITFDGPDGSINSEFLEYVRFYNIPSIKDEICLLQVGEDLSW